MTEFLKLMYLSVAVGAITLVISRAKVTLGMRVLFRKKLPVVGELVTCPYCTSHWVSFLLTLAYFPRVVVSRLLILDFVVSVFVMTALASLSIWLIFQGHSVVPEENDNE